MLLKNFNAEVYMYKFSNDLSLSLYENENNRLFQSRCTHINAIYNRNYLYFKLRYLFSIFLTKHCHITRSKYRTNMKYLICKQIINSLQINKSIVIFYQIKNIITFSQLNITPTIRITRVTRVSLLSSISTLFIIYCTLH